MADGLPQSSALEQNQTPELTGIGMDVGATHPPAATSKEYIASFAAGDRGGQ